MWSSPSTTVHSTWLAADLRGLHQPPIGSCLFKGLTQKLADTEISAVNYMDDCIPI